MWKTAPLASKTVPSPLRVLIVEDSEDDVVLLTRELQRAGFHLMYERVERSEAMAAALDRQSWDLVLADYSMPNFAGDAALALLRQRDTDVPFIFVSGTIGEEKAVAAMRVGANDYITKGNLKRLIPAIERELQDAEVRRKKRQAELLLREADARYRVLVENAPYGIYRSAMENRILEANHAMAQILGYGGTQELLSLEMPRDVYRRTCDRERVVQWAHECGSFRGFEVEWRRRDGRTITVRLSGRVCRSAAEQEETLEVIAEDVTERLALEKKVATLQKFDAIGRLAGGIAHDFNNVIGAILGWAELGLQKVSSGSSYEHYFEKIREHGRLAADLTHQLLAFSRNQPLDPLAVDLNQTVSGVVQMLKDSLGSRIRTITRLEPGAGLVLADRTQVQQVLMNLCLNARDAMPQGGELIIETQRSHVDEDYARAHPYAKPGDYVLLAVSDNGIGMDAATLERIFEPFFTTKEVGKGTGLGLATVYGVVKQHGGFINVYSEPGSGSTFRIYWPVARGQAPPQPKPAAPKITRGREVLLLAEDHEGVRMFTRESLEALGYTVLTAEDGEQAVRVFQQNAAKINLMILDVTMPGLTGPEAYRRICGIRDAPPVIFVTGYSREMSVLRELTGSGFTVIQKPFTHRMLAEQVRRLLDRSLQQEHAPVRQMAR